jgi:PucR C-terminal helix-turn-helix domain
VHPQTVRYRIAKLGELLGEGLQTPGGRFELALAVRIRRALEDQCSASGGGYTSATYSSTFSVGSRRETAT